MAKASFNKMMLKNKRGGIIEETKNSKDITDIINIKKPRNIFSLLKMLLTVTKNFTFSMNALVLFLVSLVFYYYFIKRNIVCKAFYSLLDRITYHMNAFY